MSDPGQRDCFRHRMFQSKGQFMNIPYLSCNYPNRRRTSCSTRKLSDCAVVGLQLYSVRTFHVTMSPWIYKGGQGSPQKTSTPKAIQATTHDVGYYASRGPNLSKSLCSLHHRVPEQSIPTYNPTAKCIPEQTQR